MLKEHSNINSVHEKEMNIRRKLKATIFKCYFN